MKKIVLLILALLLGAAASAQQEKKQIKTGWSISPFPAVSYNSNNGFQYGVLGDVFNFGDGSTYPDPLHKISFEASHFTKGRTRFRLQYDSKYLIPSMRLTVAGIYVNDPLYAFYGYNGSASPYEKALDQQKYYFMKRSYFQAMVNLQGTITSSFNWAAGITYWNYRMGQYDGKKFDGDPANTLFQHYADNGLIDKNELGGGNILELRAGLVYDTRDFEAAPDKGIYAELILNGAPDLNKGGHGFLRMIANFSHFVKIPVGFIPAGDPVFAYHLSYVGRLAGNAPYYHVQNVPQLVPKRIMSEGLGHPNNLRGTFENRILADSYAWANAELRIKLFRFNIANQYFYLAANPFVDGGVVLTPYRLSQQSAFLGIPEATLKKQAQEFAVSAGGGLKLVWNENFILSAEVAHNFNKGLGNPVWVFINTNYSF